MAEQNERWLSDGDCRQCRRKDYCSKPCTKFKRAYRAALDQAIREQTHIDEVKEAMRNGRNDENT